MTQPPILLVDDDLSLAQTLTGALESRGLPVDHCASGEVAIELIAAKRYPLVIIDVILEKGVSGVYVVDAIRKLPAAQRPDVFMLSDARANVRGIDHQVVTAVMLKPINFELFTDYVEATYRRAVGPVTPPPVVMAEHHHTLAPRSPRTFCGACGNEIIPWVSQIPAVALSVLDTDDTFDAWLDMPCQTCGKAPRLAGGRSDLGE